MKRVNPDEIKKAIEEKREELAALGIYPDKERWAEAEKQIVKSLSRYYGWKVLEEETASSSAAFEISCERAYQGSRSLKLSCGSEEQSPVWKKASIRFVSSGNRHQASLLAQVTLNLALFMEEDFGQDIRLVLDIRMSQHPPEHKPAHLCYVIGNPEGLEDERTVVIPKTGLPGKWNEWLLPLFEDAEKQAPGGLDNVFDTLDIRLETRMGKKAACCIDAFSIETKQAFESVRTRQKALAERLGANYGVKPFVATEITSAGPHKNSFSTHVPIIDYEKSGFNVSHD